VLVNPLFPELADASRVGQYGNWTLDDLTHAARAGMDGICVDEHQQNAYGFMPGPNLMGSAPARGTNGLDVGIVQNGRHVAHHEPAHPCRRGVRHDRLHQRRAGSSPGCPSTVHGAAGRRVSKLVLISARGLWRDDEPIPNSMVMTPEELVAFVVADPNGPVAATLLAAPDLESEAGQAAVSQSTWSLACTGKFIWPTPGRGLRKRLHRITAPTLIAWCHQDRLVKTVYADGFASAIKGSRVGCWSAAHLPQLERPSIR
jgi:hypothetical protein